MPIFTQLFEKRPSQKAMLWIGLLIAICLFFSTGTPILGKTSPQLGAQWIIDFDFTNGNVDSILTVEIGTINQQGDIENISISESRSIQCHTIGGVHPHAEGLEFDGTGYLECDLPNIQAIVYDLTRGDLLLPSRCTCKKPWMTGEVWLDPNSDLSTTLENSPGLPIFYHPDFNLTANISSNQNTGNLYFNVDQTLFWSGDFWLENNISSFEARIEKGFGNLYTRKFSFAENNLPAYGNANNILTISTLDQTIYIGHNPNGGPNLQGILSGVRGDPPCFGDGI